MTCSLHFSCGKDAAERAMRAAWAGVALAVLFVLLFLTAGSALAQQLEPNGFEIFGLVEFTLCANNDKQGSVAVVYDDNGSGTDSFSLDNYVDDPWANLFDSEGNVVGLTEGLGDECSYNTRVSAVPMGYGEGYFILIDNGNGTYRVTPGATVSIRAKARPGYSIDSWSNGAEVTNKAETVQTITVNENMVLTANFVAIHAENYSDWRSKTGFGGEWNVKDSSGTANVFRYVFNVPEGDFEEPIIDIAFEDGKVVVKTPDVVNAAGVAVSVVESSDVAGKKNVVNHTLEEATAGLDSSEGSRFYRLKADVTE